MKFRRILRWAVLLAGGGFTVYQSFEIFRAYLEWREASRTGDRSTADLYATNLQLDCTQLVLLWGMIAIVVWLLWYMQRQPVRRMVYQVGWTTLPGLQGLSVSEFRATPTGAPDNEHGVAMVFASDAECNAFLREIEAAFAARRFTNAADAFDTVKAYALEHAAKRTL